MIDDLSKVTTEINVLVKLMVEGDVVGGAVVGLLV